MTNAAMFRGKLGQATQEDGTTRPSYFIPELDGTTAPTAEMAYEWEQQRQQYEEEAYAEGAWLRAAEDNPGYRWEVEQDEARAAAFGAWFDAWCR